MDMPTARVAGFMQFDFPEGHESMKIRVLEEYCESMISQRDGKWYPCNQVPYESMWADDRYWLPQLLQSTTQSHVFDSTFVFDGPPGPTSKLLRYNHQIRND